MKKVFISLLAVLVFASKASASAIQFTTGGGRGHMFVTSENARIAAGSLVRVGYLTSTGNLGTFTDFATTIISNPGAAFPVGGFLTAPANSSSVAAAAKGAQIYLWVYNAPTAGAATQAAVFTSSDSTWIIPSGFTGDPTETSNLNLALTAGITALADPALGGTPAFARGTVTVGAGSAEGSIFRLAGIPEPGTAALSLLSLVLLSNRRSRK